MIKKTKEKLPELIEIQSKSFKDFLKKGLQEELVILENIKNIHLELQFKVKKLKYKKPQNTPEECILKSKTYNVNIYCPIKLLYKKKPILN